MIYTLPLLSLIVGAYALPWGGGHRGAATSSAVAAVQPMTAAAVVETSTTSVIDERAGETHTVTLVNRCSSGSARFLYQADTTPRGSGTFNGPVAGGVAWVDGYSGANCLSSGVNCGTVEFTLINPGTDSANGFNSINYSLQTQGNHQFVYPMDFAYTGSCSSAPLAGPCTSAGNCPGAFVGSDTASGTPVDTQGSNCGITITFC